MRIVIAPDKFKGCLSAPQVAAAIARGIREVDPAIEIEQILMADGGEGTVDALVTATGGRLVTRRVTGPLPGMKVDATFGFLGGGQTSTAVIEMSAASGLHLLQPEQYDPMKTTTYGTGELIMAAIEMGARRVILGIGGSATVDGGLGCVQACGGRPILAPDGLPAREPITGADVERSVGLKWERPFPREACEILVACDVDNPLAGPRGAARVFGPQKGATPEQVERLDRALAALGEKVGDGSLASTPGAGAAGGLGFGLMAFLGARLRPGFGLVAEAVGLAARLRGADLVVTGEGRLDASSMGGKTVVGVARLCRETGRPCVALVGSIGEGAEAAIAEGLTAYFSICDRPMSFVNAMREAPELLATAAANLVRLRL
ncbi:MAG: garK [Phycisphaerales bacterium]|nr:garK [Phycisphaerales bacterium]